MAAYRAACREVIETRFEGHIVQVKGDGILSSSASRSRTRTTPSARCGPRSHWCGRCDSLSTPGAADESLDVRVAVHHGPVYVDLHEDDVYGLAANVGARLQALAEPGEVVVSDEVRALVDERFDIEAGAPQAVKGVAEPLQPFRVLGERAASGCGGRGRTPGGARARARPPSRGVGAGCGRRRRSGATGSSSAASRASGKSRLLAALIDDARPREARVRRAPRLALPHRRRLPPGPEPDRGSRCGIDATTPTPAERLEHLAGELASLGLDAAERAPAARARSGDRARPPATSRSRPRAASSRSRSPRPRRLPRTPAPRGARRSSWPRTCTGSTTRRAPC